MGQRGRISSPPAGHASFYVGQASGWLSGLQVHFTDSCLVFHLAMYPSPFLQGRSQSIHPPQSVLLLGLVPNQVWDLALGLVPLNKAWVGPFLRLVKIVLAVSLFLL